MFKHVNKYIGDPILSFIEIYKKDKRQNLINLSVGLYYNEHSLIPQLKAVERAKTIIFNEKKIESYPYLPMEGLKSYLVAVKKLLFGVDFINKYKCIANIQTIGGSGALKIGADFLKSYFPNSQVWVSNPTWDNHISIFVGSGFKVNYYPYFDKKLLKVNFEDMLDCFNKLDKYSIVLLHPCCHNPTGSDLNNKQWDKLILVMAERKIIPFLDIAYQGFSQGLDKDAYAVRKIAKKMPCLVSQSFSKIFSLYSERIGSLSVCCNNENDCERVLGQLKATVRRNYSSPPRFVAQVVEKVLNTPYLMKMWIEEIENMRLRINLMRYKLHNELKLILPNTNFDYLLNQKGMFSLTGLNKKQVHDMRNLYGIYLLNNGRMCLSGLNKSNFKKVAKSIAKVII
ncbi:MAG: aromatic amino acid transaminase [Enterobacterales bacterium]